jgi:FixJ family two-component response regulator
MAPLIRIVDDDAALSLSLALLFRSQGWESARYADAESFLTKDDPSRPGCLVLDERLPGMKGLALLDRLKAAGAAIPAVMLTAESSVPLAVAAMKKGAADFFEKPVSPALLVNRIAELVGLQGKA